MRDRTCFLAIAGAFAISLAGCLNAEVTRDGAGCGDVDLCPPGQTCSADGQCLYPCPVPDCVDDNCGCSTTNTYRNASELDTYQCLADGLCHLRCREDSCNCPGDNLIAGPDGLCRPRCGATEGCPNGAECVESPSSQLYCHAVDATPIP
jgi:hypothetical protein